MRRHTTFVYWFHNPIPSHSSVCNVFLLLKENVEVIRWESRNLISVNSNNGLPHSILWHWCALLVSRNTGVLFCVCVFHPLTRKRIPTWPMKRHFGTTMNVDKKNNCFQRFWKGRKFGGPLLRVADTKCAEHYPCGIYFLYQRTALEN